MFEVTELITGMIHKHRCSVEIYIDVGIKTLTAILLRFFALTASSWQDWKPNILIYLK
jgi:hypothetical protein